MMEMLDEQQFPENTLFCADGGYIGNDFWRVIEDHGHHFLVRVGGNVRLLKSLGYVRERDGIVYSWSKDAVSKKRLPMVLRLLHYKDARNCDVYRVTNVLNNKLLSDRQAGKMYRQRWGIEIQLRSLKQTFGRTKLLSRTPDRAETELVWSLVGLWMLQLLAHKEQVKAPDPLRQTSLAAVLRIVRRMMQRDDVIPDRSKRLNKQLKEAVTREQRMQSLWDAHRGRCYEKVISFTTMVHLVADSLLKHRGSGRRAFEKGIENGELETTVGSAFKKLRRLPVA